MPYFTTLSNNAESYQQKIDIINLICFLTSKMNQKNPDKYPNAIAVLGAIFNTDLTVQCNETTGHDSLIRAFGLICDDLMWGTKCDIPKPEGYTNASEIKNVIVSYFTDEWKPF